MSAGSSALVQNERIKLLAGALNKACTSCFTVGIATPLAGSLYNVSGFRESVSPALLIFGLSGWLLAAVSLHALARRFLGKLEL